MSDNLSIRLAQATCARDEFERHVCTPKMSSEIATQTEVSARRAAERCCEEILCAGVSILFRLEECRTETGGGSLDEPGGGGPRQPDS